MFPFIYIPSPYTFTIVEIGSGLNQPHLDSLEKGAEQITHVGRMITMTQTHGYTHVCDYL